MDVLAKGGVALRQIVTSDNRQSSHVGQDRQLVEVPALRLQLREDGIQPVHADDPLSKGAGGQVVGDGHIGLGCPIFDFLLVFRGHPCCDDRGLLFLHFVPFSPSGAGGALWWAAHEG